MVELIKTPDFDANAGGESPRPVRAPVLEPHVAPSCNGVRVCGRNRTETREREWAEGTVSTVLSPVRHQLVTLLARSVSIVTGRQPIEQLEGYDVIG